MINLYLNYSIYRKQRGAATLLITFVLFTAAVLIIIFATNYSMLQQKTSTNQYSNNQAFEAAEAGLDYAVANLQVNSSTVLANPSGGFINFTVPTVTLGNNSTYSVAYTNPTANSYSLLTITATGKSVDGTSTKALVQQVNAGASSLQYTITTQQNVVTSGVVNINGPNGTDVGGTITSSGQFNSNNNKTNDSTLANMSSATLFSNIFGMSQSAMQAQSTVYNNPSTIPYNSLSGDVWINGAVTLSGNYTIGTTANPVLLIVNGNLTVSGNITINGLLYVLGSTTASGTFNLNGGIVSQGAITLSGTSVSFNSSILQKLTGSTYARVPGSWKDF